MPVVSVIIPTLNEAGIIEDTLKSLPGGVHEVIVADGGSSDATPEIASSLAHVIEAPRGRASQMNAGAAVATGDVLLFLHADTRLPHDALAAIARALREPCTESGTFRLRFSAEAPLLRFYSACTRVLPPAACFGDRGLFVRRAAFEAVGGFPEVPLFEDVEMVRRLHRRGGFRFLQQSVTTSARRFERHGLVRQQLRNVYLWLRYLGGADPERLAHLYRYE
jgi:rSAM/selenodomain-associated transferase 2